MREHCIMTARHSLKCKVTQLAEVTVTLLLMNLFIDSLGQTARDTARSISVKKIAARLVIDGQLNETEWQQSEVATGFYNQFPSDKGLAANQTEIRILFNESYVYFSAVCHFNPGYEPVIESLKRDNQWWLGDAVSVIFDPQGARANGMMFALNSAGAQGDCTVGNQVTVSTYNLNWDAQWFSATRKHNDKWVAEMAIPFAMLRYKQDKDQWIVQFIRYDTEYNSISTWNHVPINLANFNLLKAGNLEWKDALPKFKGNVSLAPFLTTGATQVNGESKPDYSGKAGLDSKIALNTSLNLDVTINPDFSQVDVDQQAVNLTRFSLFFPERRFFFLENADMFSNMGVPVIRPFFSRRIGLKNGNIVPLAGGLRLTGNVNPNLRIGVMNMTEQPTDTTHNNFTVGAFQQILWKNSIVQGLFTNVQTMGNSETKALKYNRTAGLELKYLTEDRKWNIIGRYHQAFRDDIDQDNRYLHFGATYNTQKWFIDINYLNLGQNYVNDLGFTPRLFQYDPLKDSIVRVGFVENFSEVYYRMFTQDGSKVSFHGPKLTSDIYFRGGNAINESDVLLIYEVNFRNQSYLSFGARDNYVDLFYPVYLLDGDFEPLPAISYHFTASEFNYQSRPANTFSYALTLNYGQFYSGKRLSVNPEIKLRIQPFANLRAYYSYNDIKLTGLYGEGTYHLIGSSVELLFSTKMFWTTFFQYNTQSDNVNINSRFQWRFRPLSDLFVVYTDNYTNDFVNKNRGIVVKFVYWFRVNN